MSFTDWGTEGAPRLKASVAQAPLPPASCSSPSNAAGSFLPCSSFLCGLVPRTLCHTLITASVRSVTHFSFHTLTHFHSLTRVPGSEGEWGPLLPEHTQFLQNWCDLNSLKDKSAGLATNVTPAGSNARPLCGSCLQEADGLVSGWPAQAVQERRWGHCRAVGRWVQGGSRVACRGGQ